MLLSRRLVISSKYQNFQLSKYTKRSKSPPILSFPWNSFCLFFSLDNKMFNGKGKSTPLVYYIPSTFSGILHDSSSPLKRIISFLLLCVRLLFKTLYDLYVTTLCPSQRMCVSLIFLYNLIEVSIHKSYEVCPSEKRTQKFTEVVLLKSVVSTTDSVHVGV